MKIHSHSLSHDDIVIFYKVNMSNIEVILNMFDRYVNISGQKINPSKSIIFYGFITIQRLNIIAKKLGFEIGCALFSFLGGYF